LRNSSWPVSLNDNFLVWKSQPRNECHETTLMEFKSIYIF
jgi:hypothetical protein